MNNAAMVIAPNGRAAYVTSNTDALVHQYDIGADGKLTAKTPPTLPVPGATWPAITPDGNSLYVRGAGLIAQFNVGRRRRIEPEDAGHGARPGVDRDDLRRR